MGYPKAGCSTPFFIGDCEKNQTLPFLNGAPSEKIKTLRFLFNSVNLVNLVIP
jgi:hypothetical protein